jgi:hypothetical protein
MNIIATLLLPLLISSSLFAQGPTAQQTRARAVFMSFHDSLERLKRETAITSNKEKESDVEDSLENISDYVKFLEAVISSGKPVPDEFLEGVALDAEFLKQIANRQRRSDPELQRVYDNLKDLEDDLAIKVTNNRSGGDVARVVQVLIRAKKGDQDVSAYEVWYTPKAWEFDAQRRRRFDKLTSLSNPSSMTLAPGRYYFWLTKERFESEHKLLNIGVNGESKQEIDLVVQ